MVVTVARISYAARCALHYAELVAQGHDPRAAGFASELCQRLRLESGMTRLTGIVDLFKEKHIVEVWDASGARVPEWF